MFDASLPCPCGRACAAAAPQRSAPTKPRTQPQPASLRYADCCGRWHAGPEHLAAPDAESLMRSRYSAFVLDLRDYLLATWAPATRPAQLAGNEPGLCWLGLQVLSHTVQDEHHAEVHFIARSKLGGRAYRLEERSRFERDATGRWLYVDGELR